LSNYRSILVQVFSNESQVAACTVWLLNGAVSSTGHIQPSPLQDKNSGIDKDRNEA
jgi:hypothetical protein